MQNKIIKSFIFGMPTAARKATARSLIAGFAGDESNADRCRDNVH